MTLPLHLWDLPRDASQRLINVSENRTYLVAAGDRRAVLRVHRPGYQSRAAIESELLWMASLAADTPQIGPPEPIAGRDGAHIQGSGPLMVLFRFIQGAPPPEDAPPALWARLGEMAAILHIHARTWPRPQWFTRPAWTCDTLLGRDAVWGDWRAALDLGPLHCSPNTSGVRGLAPAAPPAAEIHDLLHQAEARIRNRLAQFGTGPDRFGLIHADMRAANLLQEGDRIRLIDFDDCGFGWFLYDFAASVSFVETRPDLGALKSAWMRGYRKHAPLSSASVEMLDTFVMARRLALMGWVASHRDAPEAQALAPGFAAGTAALAARYLRSEPF